MEHESVGFELGQHRVAEDDLFLLEERLQIRFPPLYRDIVIRFGNAYPRPNRIMVKGLYEACFGQFILPRLTDAYGVLSILRSISCQVPDKIIPFGYEPGGDLFCFDYRMSMEPKVVYWNREGAAEIYGDEFEPIPKEVADAGADGKAILHLANTFEEFLGLLC